MTPEDFKRKVLTVNEELASLLSSPDEKFDVLYIKKQKQGNKYYAVVRVSNNVRKFIENMGNRVYIGMYSCSVYDQFYIKRCNNCQKFHHYKDKCKSVTPTCAKCAGQHSTEQCDKCDDDDFVPTCVNCCNDKSSFAHTHEATSMECPSYQAAQDKLRKTLQYYSKN